MTRETERLIDRLVSGLEPTTRVPRLRWVAAGVLLMGGAMVALKLALSGLRLDVRALSVDPSFAVVLIGLALVAAGGLGTALGASIPGRRSLALCSIGALVGGAAALVGAGVGLALEGGLAATEPGPGLVCLVNATLIAVAPGVALGAFVLRAAAHRPLVALAAAAGGAVGIGACGVHLTCPSNDALHMMAFHALAPLVGGALVWLALRALEPRLQAGIR